MLNKIQLNKKIITSLILLAFFISIIGILTPTATNHVTNAEVISLNPINDKVNDNIKLSLNAGVDLVVGSISVPKTVIEYGVSPWTWATFTIKNVGTDPIYDTIIYAEFESVTKDGVPYSPGGYLPISNYTAPLKSGDIVSQDFAVGHDTAWPVGAYSVYLKIDSRYGIEYITETDESNNVSPELSFFVGNPGVDFVISNISIPTTTIVSNQTPWTWVTFEVRNLGVFPFNFSSITTDLVNVTKDGSPYTPGGFMEVNTYSVPLFPGQSAPWSFAVGHDAAWPVGEYSLQVYADHRGTSTYVSESNELNNLSPELRFTVVPKDTRPDLVITDISIPTAVIEYGVTPWTWVNFTVKNVGSGPVTNSSIIGDLVNVLRNGVSFPIGGYFNVINYAAPLNPGDIATHLFAVGHDDVWPVGEYSIQVRIDAWNYENETDESNNLSPVLRFIVIEEGQVDPIVINSNADFQAAGFSGDGSANNPYILENVIISNSTVPLVEIHNTDAYFVIKNSNFNGLNGAFPAIILDNVVNGKIENNNIQRSSTGIHFSYTFYSSINGNIIGNNSEYGVWFADSSNNEITLNEIGNNGFDGIFFEASSYNYIFGNRIYANGHTSVVRLSISGSSSLNGLKASFGAGIFLDPSPYNVLDDNVIFDNAQNGIQLLESNYISASGNDVYGNGLGGISILNSSHGIFNGNHISSNGFQAPSLQISEYARLSINSPDSLQASFGAGIFLDPSFNTTIYQNTIESNYGEGIYLFVTSSTDISGNKVKNNGFAGIFVQDSSEFDITNNDIIGNGFKSLGVASSDGMLASFGAGIFLDPSTSGYVANNLIAENGFDGIFLFKTSDTEITDNEIRGNGQHGVFLQDSSSNSITGNTISHNGNFGTVGPAGLSASFGAGIFLDPSENNYVAGNTISNNAQYGVHLQLSDNSDIFNNTITENGENGIFLENSDGNTIKSNEVIGNGATTSLASASGLKASFGAGIFLDPSVGNVVEDNFIANNEYGIFFQESSGNQISFNVMKNNRLYGLFLDGLSNDNSIKNNDFIKLNGVDGESQAYDDGIGNDFLNNYWSDHEDPTLPYKIAGKAGNEDPEPASVPNVYEPSILSDPTVLFPNGGESLSETVEVKWEYVEVAFEEVKVTYSVFISSNDGETWKLLEDGLTDNTYDWDTTKVNNDEYLLKVVAFADGDETSDTSDGTFKVSNREVSTTITTSPGWTLFGILGALIGVFFFKKRRAN